MRSNRAIPSTNRAVLSALALLSLAACSEESPGDPQPAVTPIDCALAGSTEFTPDCTMERDKRDDMSLLIVRNPDGGFHRLELGVEGRGIVAADGADTAIVRQRNGVAEVQLGPDRYRLPLAD